MRQAHYLEPLKTTSIPADHVVFDCETRLTHKHGKSAHRWVCGAYAKVHRTPDGSWLAPPPVPVQDPAELWELITEAHVKGRRLVVWAHNLSFDLRISEALRYLPQNGYTLEAVVLERTAAWASFTSRSGPLMLCDLFSWLPTSLDKMADDCGVPRGGFDYAQADEGELEARVFADVTFTQGVLRTMLEYLEGIDAGPFRPTGSGQSHAFWRKNYLPAKRVLVHGDEYALERERVAMHAGRAEAWKVGQVDGPLHEYDLNLAYCRIAAANELPVRLSHRIGQVGSPIRMLGGAGRAYLCEVDVETDQPLVPVSDGAFTYWPVGEFTTTLWDPEVDLLYGNDAVVRVRRAWVYDTEPVLHDVSQFLIDALEGEIGEPPAPMHRLLKHWARTIVGRCGLRYREWEHFGTVPVMGLGLSTMYDSETCTQTELLHVGERVMELADMAEADSSVPQITGWVMSKARANLWQIMKCAGLENLAYVDTDSVIVSKAGAHNLEEDLIEGGDMLLFPKDVWSSAYITGPRNIILEDTRRIAGIPKRATRIGDTTYDGEVWAGVKASLSGRQLDNVAVTQRLFKVSQINRRRTHRPDGSTVPVEVHQLEPR